MNKINNTRYRITVFVLVTLGLIGLVYTNFYLPQDKVDDNNVSETKKNYKYGKYVKVNKDSYIYKKNKDNYNIIGIVYKDTLLALDDGIDIYYYKISNSDYYVNIRDLLPIDDIYLDDRYKNYIVFNENAITDGKTVLYDEFGNKVLSINEGFTMPIIKKETDYYGVEYVNRLLYLKKEDVTVINANNTSLTNSSGIGVLNYHAFYEDGDISCTTSICHSEKQFKEQLDYIKNNNILTLKMEEVEDYVNGKINLPKSVLLTIDDGGRTKVAIKLLTEYQMQATIFLVTSWYNPSDFSSDYISLHSHSHNMHNTGECPKGQGGAIQCKSESYILSDLQKSRELLNNTTYFAYPFYEYNDYSIEMLKKAGFTMAFTGESTKSDNLVHPSDNKFKLKRFVIVDYTTINDIDKYFSNIK